MPETDAFAAAFELWYRREQEQPTTYEAPSPEEYGRASAEHFRALLEEVS